ncbi:hypothetical protein [uncultured Polaribacter sp.]|uniref:hypothetical protein n=1 Tax=uncultured Polaribacter sp. TaxID=174711 RepID=UPI002605B6DC|nr:hypothetical protein [uncultured Polaribacter sp.]
MQKSVLFIAVLLFSSLFYSQNKKEQFPLNALGIYKGDLTISSNKGVQIVPMEFHLLKTEKTNTFKYVIVYKNKPRNYTLITKDLKNGIFNIDENNGIVLPAKYANNVLYSFFEVNGNFLSSRLLFKNNSLDFEILFTAIKNKITTGGTSTAIPKVFGYPITTVQKAVLIKQ